MVELDFDEYSEREPDEGKEADEGKRASIPWGIAFGLGLNDSHFVGDAVTLNNLDGVAKQTIAIFCFRLRYRYRVACPINVRRAINVDTVILHIADVTSVVRDSFGYCQMLTALASCNEEGNKDDDNENDD